MSGFRDKGFSDRLNTAQNARKAMQQRFLAKPGADDPAVVERREARKALSAARDVRLAERQAQKLADKARLAAEQEAREAAAREQETIDAVGKAERAAALEIEQKAARDARYAARKARNR